MSPEPPEILLVEDNIDHAELIIRCLKSNSIDCTVQHVHDGSQALDYLFKRNNFADSKKNIRPALVLIDLRMPEVDGLEVLRQVKEDDKLRFIPIVVLTTSKANQDIVDAFACHANSYLVKPFDYDVFRSQLLDLCTYWLKWNKLPGISEQ